MRRLVGRGGVTALVVVSVLVLSDGSRHSSGGPKSARLSAKAQLVRAYGGLPLSFEPNRGQADPSVRFIAHMGGATLFVTGSGALLSLDGRDGKPAYLNSELIGASLRPSFVPEQALTGRMNYLLGSDPGRWQLGIPTYARVVERSIYPSVDLAYYGHGGSLEYDFLLRPGADPDVIALGFPGSRHLRIDGKGDLRLELGGRQLRQLRPTAYQLVDGTRHSVRARFRLEGGRIGFVVGSYDHRLPLIIDPTLIYSTYLGGYDANGAPDDSANDIAVDPSGNAYVIGTTYSMDFPTLGATQSAFAGGTDAFVTKLNASGNALVYSTYLGGSVSQVDFQSLDSGEGIAVDTSGNAYVTGYANSRDFPTLNPLQAACAEPADSECRDAFVAKLGPTGTLVYSTFLGGTGEDNGAGIAVDLNGNAYVTGETQSLDFPTANPLQPTGNGGDAFVAKLNSNGDTLVYSTYLGGSPGVLVKCASYASGIAVDTAGSAYITGSTCSSLFPTTANVFQTSIAGTGMPYPSTAFVSKLAPSGDSLDYSTYLGGSGVDYAEAIALDSSGSAYVTGSTDSPDFPVLNPLPGQASCNLNGDGISCSRDAFVTKLSSDGSALTYSTYLGAPLFSDEGRDIAVDSAGAAHVTGDTGISCCSPNFPSVNPLQDPGGDAEAFVTKLVPTGKDYAYSTFLGGCIGEEGNGIAIDAADNAYVTGWTNSPNFPTSNSLQPLKGYDAFVTKLSPANSFITLAPCQTQPQADLSITKRVETASPIFVGQQLVYTLTVTNNGPTDAANDVYVTDTLPASVTFVSATASQGSCSGTSTIGCLLGPLANGASATVTIVVTPTAAGNLTNTAMVSSSTGDSYSTNNESTATTTVNPEPGQARIVKTVAGAMPNGAESFAFQLRQGASVTAVGTILESGNANTPNSGTIDFATKLTPGTPYALCETVLPGWMTTLGPPFYVVYNPSGDNSTVCTDFSVQPGETRTFAIDNQPPPGGLARTIGFWKNWASCAKSNGHQAPILDQTLSAAEPAGITIGSLTLHASDCLSAVRLLNKSTIDTGKKQASDPGFGLAAQLLAAKLNGVAGAGTCPTAVNAINDAQTLLASINFNGLTHTNLKKTEATQANSLADTLDSRADTLDTYNNNQLC
jgi:uncharacterized repeat protein (TIGR01451 family)